MNKCSNCGNPMPPEHQMCANCGHGTPDAQLGWKGAALTCGALSSLLVGGCGLVVAYGGAGIPGGLSFPQVAKGCWLGFLGTVATLSGLMGGCGLVFTVSMLGNVRARDDMGIGPFAIFCFVVGGLIFGVCMWQIHKARKP